MRSPARIKSVADAEHYARRRLPASLSQLIEGGSGVGCTVGANIAAFERITFQPRVAVAHPATDLSTTLLGKELSMPVVIAPNGNLRVIHRDGEPGVARAAGDAGTIHFVSCFTGYPIEAVVASAPGPVFFQLYFLGGRANTERMVERARAAGCEALVITVDTGALIPREIPVRRRRELPTALDVRTAVRFAPQVLRRPRWLLDLLRDRLKVEAPMALRPDGRVMTMWEALADVTVRRPVWDDVEWIRERWGGPVVVKGVLSAADARRAVDVGADAVVVSNHGGNVFDGLPATVEVLPEVVAAVGDETEVLVDGGIRRGSDVVKAVALGARAVLIGRGYLWAHAAAGEAGVRRMLDLFRDEIRQTLVQIGCPSVAELDASYLRGAGDPAGLVT